VSSSSRILEPTGAQRPPPWWDDDRALAYVVLEQARAVCEEVRQRPDRIEEVYALREIHRHLGLAGYFVSEELEPQLRHALWEIVAAHGAVRITAARDREQLLLLLAAHARQILWRCVGDPPRDDHLQSAYRHNSQALAQLMRFVGMTRSSAVVSRASADGRFDRKWQRARLVPLPWNSACASTSNESHVDRAPDPSEQMTEPLPLPPVRVRPATLRRRRP
jgi:hypothetical protein